VSFGLLLMSSGGYGQTDLTELEDDFRRGNRLFEEKDYDSAIVVYSSILDGNIESAALYFNLGNAYFKNGDLGHAILNFLRAKRLEPGDPDIAGNLEFARRFTSVQMEGVRLNPVNTLLDSIVDPYHLSTLTWSSSLFFVVFIVFLTLRIGLKIASSPVRVGLVLSLLLMLTLSLLTTKKYDNDYLTQRGVIVAEECIVRTGPSELSDKELDASPGLIVEILSRSGDYYNVLFENKRRGWVLKDLIAVI